MNVSLLFFLLLHRAGSPRCRKPRIHCQRRATPSWESNVMETHFIKTKMTEKSGKLNERKNAGTADVRQLHPGKPKIVETNLINT